MDIQNLYSLFQSSSGVSIDSRSIKKDQIFFSIKGENFDGNSFALDAIDKGAKFSIVDDPELRNKNDKIIFVENSLKELQNLSKYILIILERILLKRQILELVKCSRMEL